MIKKILISQPAPTTGKSPYLELEEKYDVKVDFRPLIHVERVTEQEFRKQRINILDSSAVIFTTRYAIESFFDICKDMRLTMPEDMKYFFLSEKIALYIQKYVHYRKRKIFFPKTGKWEDLIDLMAKHKKETYLFPVNEVHHQDLSSLDAKNLQHTECVMYRTVSTKLDKSVPFDYDLIAFFTPGGVKSLTDNFPDYQQGNTLFACWGESAAKEMEARNYRLDLKAPTPNASSMPAALDLFLQELADKQ